MGASTRRTGWSLALLLGLLVLWPTASACHASLTTQAGAVVQEQGPAPARISFPLGACEGDVEVTVELGGPQGETSETFTAHLEIDEPGGACLPWDVCEPRHPPAASFTLSTSDGALELHGVMENTLHATEVAQLEGTYRGDPASFTLLKPI